MLQIFQFVHGNLLINNHANIFRSVFDCSNSGGLTLALLIWIVEVVTHTALPTILNRYTLPRLLSVAARGGKDGF